MDRGILWSHQTERINNGKITFIDQNQKIYKKYKDKTNYSNSPDAR